jgi:hypothetical protein
VRHTLSETKIGHRFEAPTNGKGRNVKLTVGVTNALKRHRKVQLDNRMQRAGLWEEYGSYSPTRSVNL